MPKTSAAMMAKVVLVPVRSTVPVVICRLPSPFSRHTAEAASVAPGQPPAATPSPSFGPRLARSASYAARARSRHSARPMRVHLTPSARTSPSTAAFLTRSSSGSIFSSRARSSRALSRRKRGLRRAWRPIRARCGLVRQDLGALDAQRLEPIQRAHQDAGDADRRAGLGARIEQHVGVERGQRCRRVWRPA